MADNVTEIGTFNRYFIWQKYNAGAAVDFFGQPVRDGSRWTNQTGFWASKKPATGREVVNDDRLKGLVSDVVKGVSPGDIQPQDRLQGVHAITGSPYFLNIEAVLLPEDDGRFVTLLCSQVTNSTESG